MGGDPPSLGGESGPLEWGGDPQTPPLCKPRYAKTVIYLITPNGHFRYLSPLAALGDWIMIVGIE